MTKYDRDPYHFHSNLEMKGLGEIRMKTVRVLVRSFFSQTPESAYFVLFIHTSTSGSRVYLFKEFRYSFHPFAFLVHVPPLFAVVMAEIAWQDQFRTFLITFIAGKVLQQVTLASDAISSAVIHFSSEHNDQ